MTDTPKVSIVMPAYNASLYIEAAIRSVIEQTWTNWELLIVDNNSSDDTALRVFSFQDNRIRLFKEPRQGVGFARNLGLSHMNGSFFCFLDADDLLPKNSLRARIDYFQANPHIDFLDGIVHYIDQTGNFLPKTFKPSFRGEPFPSLLRLDQRCLFGNTWMVRRRKDSVYRFETDMTHAEDLFFYLSISQAGKYDYVNEPVLLYRQHTFSAMRDLRGLENGYKQLILKVKDRFREHYSSYLKWRIIRIMFLSWLRNGRNPVQAVYSFFRLIWT